MNDHFLSGDQVEAYRLIRAMDGPNAEIEDILLKDRAMRVAWDRALADSTWAAAPKCASTRATAPPPAVADRPEAVAVQSGSFVLPDLNLVREAVDRMKHKSTTELRDILRRLIESLHPHAAKRKPHEEVRKWIWAVNIALTDRGEVPPCVRSQPGLGRFVNRSFLTDAEKKMLNDRQVFDLLYMHKHQLGKPKRKWESLLRSPTFDYELAARFVATVGSAEKKIDALGLREDEQMHLAAIRSDAVRKRWERIRTDAERLEGVLCASLAKGMSRIESEDIPAWCEEYVALRVAGGSPSHASRLLKQFYCRVKPANQLANRKGHLASKGFPVPAS